VEGVSKDPSDRRRRSMSRSGSNLEISAVNDAMQENGHDGHTHEAQMLAERVVAMDEEMKMLKEALSQRNGEVQSARLMCSKTTAQLSVVEEELKKAKQLNGISPHLILKCLHFWHLQVQHVKIIFSGGFECPMEKSKLQGVNGPLCEVSTLAWFGSVFSGDSKCRH
jgi:hypothetical protein